MSAIFVTIATEKVYLMPEFYTWTIVLINQLSEIGDKQLSVFGSRRPNLCLNARTPLLWEGGFGKVYKGKWNGTDVAIKEIKTHLRNRIYQEQVIKNEVGIYSRIIHPGIVQIMCIVYTQRSVLLVSECVDG